MSEAAIDLMAEVRRVRDLLESEPWGLVEFSHELKQAGLAVTRGDRASARLWLETAVELFDGRKKDLEGPDECLSDEEMERESEILLQDLRLLRR